MILLPVSIHFCLLLFLAHWTIVTSAYAIVGATGNILPSGERPSRLNFDDLRASGPAFDLYILSLQRLQQQDQSDQLSYYRVAGIHGRPFTAWDGVQGQYASGYCTHGSILFPMWHRPYLALFEQLLWNHAQDIANSYPISSRTEYLNAASTLRIPYWDWARNASMPDAVTIPQLLINTPTGSQNIPNPLYSYTFHPQPSASDFPPTAPLAKYHSTVRYPDANGNSQQDRVNAQLETNAQLIRDLTYSLLTTEPDYAAFSNTGYTDLRGNRYNSIENIHNGIHAFVGNGGHMGIIPYSAFDPIFWLHHANVDRLIALWQALNPESFVTSEINLYGTFTSAPGVNETESSPLTPFHDASNQALYSSNSVRSTRTFGYTYPELNDWNVSTSSLTASVQQAVDRMYGPGGNEVTRRSISTSVLAHPPFSNHSLYPLSTGMPSLEQSQEGETAYYLNIRTSKSVLQGSYFIHFFFGSPPANSSKWSTAPNLIGSQAILYTPSAAHQGTNLSTTIDNVTVVGQIPLHAPLRQYHFTQRTGLANSSLQTTSTSDSDLLVATPSSVYQHHDHNYTISRHCNTYPPHGSHHNHWRQSGVQSSSSSSIPAFLRKNLNWRIQMLTDDIPIPLQSPVAEDLRAVLKISVVTEKWEVVKGVTCGMLGGMHEQEGG